MAIGEQISTIDTIGEQVSMIDTNVEILQMSSYKMRGQITIPPHGPGQLDDPNVVKFNMQGPMG